MLRGATPVFVDIRRDTLNIDENKIEAAITNKTKAIVPVHYAGVGCEMKMIMDIAEKYGIIVIEDAAQGILSSYNDQPLGSIGHLGAYSFHETKNIISGEGGALLINDPELIQRAEIIREKGTNRTAFFRGEIEKYTWMDIGSSYLPSDIIAAFLWAQLEQADAITQQRKLIWDTYSRELMPLRDSKEICHPTIPDNCKHNAHMFYIILNSSIDRKRFIARLNSKGIDCVFHYVPLHSSPMGDKYGRVSGKMTNTDDLSSRLVRLPVWLGIEEYQHDVVAKIFSVIHDLEAF